MGRGKEIIVKIERTLEDLTEEEMVVMIHPVKHKMVVVVAVLQMSDLVDRIWHIEPL